MASTGPGATAAPADPRLARQRAIDERMMRHALALGRRGLGNTWPNPAVGAVVWRMDGDVPVIVGRGFTQPGGRPHAETVALAQAGEAARGASIAVTLEPCSHHGHTAPCCDAIVAAGIARVVSAIEDPDPRVNGRGHIRLRAAGVDVEVGVMAREARAANLGFVRRIVDKRPMVTLKLASTADGFAAPLDGPRLLITGEAANRRVHMMRAQHDAVLVGIGTALADDPQLTCRLPGLASRSPVRVVADAALRLPLDGALVRTASGVPVWVIAALDAPAGRDTSLAERGVLVERVARGPDGHLSLPDVLAVLARRGVTRVFCEGGPALAAGLARARLVDVVVAITGESPLGRPGLPAIPPELAALTADSHLFESGPAVRLGPDTLQSWTRRH
jgi:diaminohydroxyphosphoribosylaminopyrimidine deaminase/5-amino-6-(5-phosphoribosylamino)uracil reductase